MEKGAFEESATSFRKASQNMDDGLDIEKMSLKNTGFPAKNKGKKDEVGFFRNKRVFFLTV